MRPSFLFALAGMAFWGTAALCQETAPDIARSQVAFKTQNATADDYLLNLAQKSGTNIIADATTLPKEANLNIDSNDKMLNLSIYFAQAYELGMHRFNANTFVFTPEPDLAQIGALLAAGKGYPLDNLDAKSTTSLRALSDYARPLIEKKRVAGAEPVLSVPFADLTPPLKAQVMDLALGSPNNPPLDTSLLFPVTSIQWLRDDFWKQAILKNLPQSGATPFIVGNARTSVGIAQLLREIAGPISTVHSMETPAGEIFPPVRTAQADDFTPVLRSWQRATWEKQLAEPKLDAKCTLEGKRTALKDVLSQVSAQSGVLLRSETAKTNLFLTMHATLSARDWMGVLSRLSGATWQHEADGTYVLQGEATPVQRAFLQMGDLEWYRWRDHNVLASEERDKRRQAANRSVQQQAGAALNSPEGFAWTDLDEDTAQTLRADVEDAMTYYLIRNQIKIDQISDANLTFKLEKIEPNPDAPAFALQKGEKLTLDVKTSNGALLARRQLWPELKF